MSAPLNIQQAADLVDLSIQKIWIKSSEPEVVYPKYFNTRMTTDYLEKDSSLSGLGEADFVDENASILIDVPVQGYKKTYTQAMVSCIVAFTYQMWKFGIKKRDLDNVATELKASIARQRERLCIEQLENGFASTSYTHTGPLGSRTITTAGGDGLGSFTSSHTREDGGSNMNNGIYDGTTYNLPFDYAGLKAAWRTASLFVDPRGNPRPANLTKLVCKTGSPVHYKAQEVLGAIRKGQIPESFDHDANAGAAFEIIDSPYFTQANYWYMFDSSRALTDKEGFQFIESEAPHLDPVNVVYRTSEVQTKAVTLFDLGHNDVTRSWVASKGDSTSLS